MMSSYPLLHRNREWQMNVLEMKRHPFHLKTFIAAIYGPDVYSSSKFHLKSLMSKYFGLQFFGKTVPSRRFMHSLQL